MTKLLVDSQLSQEDELFFIRGVVGRIEAWRQMQWVIEQFWQFAKWLHQTRFIYYFYALMDGLSISYSEFKLIADMFISSAAQAQHDLLCSPEIIPLVVLESVFIISFSVVAAYFDNDKEHKTPFREKFAEGWIYLRHIFKATKNAFKGLRTTLLIAAALGANGIMPILLPLSITMGLLAAANRVWLQKMINKRKVAMEENVTLLTAILTKPLSDWNPEDVEQFSGDIRRQSFKSRAWSMVAVALGGVVDGFYLYMGLLSLVVMPIPLLWPMFILSLSYMLGCIAFRLYEEFDYQNRLTEEALKCELAILYKQLAYLHTQNPPMSLWKTFMCFEQKRQELVRLGRRRYLGAALIGLKHGLTAYGALSAVMFFLAIILFFTSTAFPIALVATVIALGLVLVGLFVGQALFSQWRHNQALSPRVANRRIEEINWNSETLYQDLLADLNNPSLKDSYWFAFFETIRSFFSGLGKGQRCIDFTLNPLQVDGNDPPVMLVIGGISSIIFGLVLALRAFARGFGKDPMTRGDLLAKTAPAEDLSSQEPEIVATKTPESTATPEATTTPEGDSINSLAHNRNAFYYNGNPRQTQTPTPSPPPSPSTSNRSLHTSTSHPVGFSIT